MEEELVERYLGTATQLEQAPFDRELHLVHLDLLQQLNLVDELAQARLALLQCYPLTTAQWLAWFADSRAKLDDAQAHVDLLELFGRASQDYVSIPLLLVYSTHTIAAYYAAHGLAPPPPLDEDEDDPDVQMQTDGVDSRKTGDVDEVLSAVYSLKVCRQIREEVLAIGGTHLSQSHKLWNVWRDFEMDLLRMSTNAEQLAVLDALYLARLEVPHIGIDQTFAAYSSLITKYNNSAYSTALPAANKLYAIAKKAVELREVKEAELSKGKFASWAYLNYIRWELEVKKPDIELVKSLFERAVYDCAERVGPVKELEEVWDEYFAFATATPKKFVNLVNIADRAVRSCPASGLLWANHFRVSERFKLGADVVEAAFERATATRLLEGQVEQLVVLYEARADFHRREVDALVGPDDVEGDMIDLVVAILLEGITKVKAIKGADAQLRLEKYLIRQYERFNRVDEARQVWADLTTRYSHNYAVWYGRADFETRRGTAKMAHEVYLAGCSARHLDYPEYLLQAWLAFEHQNGTLSDLEFARVKGGRMTRGIEARRRREGLAAGPAVAASTADADDFIASAVQDSSMDVSTTQKRERDEMAPPEGTGNAKKVKVEADPAAVAAGVPEEQKRDRENSTVFVISPLEAQTTEEDLKRLFADCGEVRECKVKTIGEQHLAMVEFMEKDSVLAAQTKDKKRIRNVEVDVHIAWKSCLYVTNFPESYDKAKVEELFAPFGTIFDTRWPSKRFKNTRRFCYVQFTLAESAEAALSLHNTTLDDSKLVVYISDPGRKKGRSDANANAKELYVAGLSKFVKEADLKRLFEPYGTIKGIRVSLDDKAECRGFAFVEYEDEAAAIASLALNNHELKKRRMSVTIAQSRIVGTQKVVEGSGERKADADSKNLRVRGIPPGTEEPIVQQAFERFAKVRRVLMEEGSSEATIEFEDDAEAGKALMAKASIKIDDVDLEIFTEGAQLRTIDGKKPSAVKSSGGDVKLLPRQASRGRGRVGLRGNRRGVGARAGAINVSSTTPMAVDSSSTVGTNKTQDDFRAMLNKK